MTRTPRNSRNDADELVAVNVRLLRKVRGMRGIDLAGRMADRGHRWRDSTVYDVEGRGRGVRAGELADLAEVLDVPVGALFAENLVAAMTSRLPSS